MSIRTCKITVKGNGNGGYGHTREDRTRTVEDFLIDNNVVYPAVYGHVRRCGDAEPCDPAEVLRIYLARRDSDKFHGKVSQSLMRLALQYKGRFKDRVPDDLVRQFVIRHCYSALLDQSDLLGTDGVVDGIYFQDAHLRGENEREGKYREPWVQELGGHKDHPLYEMVRFGFRSFKHGLPPRGQFVNLARVHEVMAA